MLTGRTSVYIDPLKSGEEIPLLKKDEEEDTEKGDIATEDASSPCENGIELPEVTEEETELKSVSSSNGERKLDRSQFGKFVINFGQYL